MKIKQQNFFKEKENIQEELIERNKLLKEISKEKEEQKYYNPDKILNKKDLNGKEPAIYLISTNRSAGKTTAFLKKCCKLKNKKKKFVLIYRYTYELSSANMIFEDVLKLYPELGTEMTIKSCAKGLFYELFLDGVSVGFSVAMSNPDSLKKYSALFADVEIMVMDEFQTESGKYLKDEPNRLQSLYLTIARGGGSQSRLVKVFLLGNMISIMNPYFIFFGIHKRLKADTKFMRGNGWVAEFGFNESASKSIKENPFFSAFEDNNYMKSSTEKVYMYDSSTFCEKLSGKSKYLFTLIYDKEEYGIRDFFEEGILYISRKSDKNFPYRVSFKASDHTQNTIMLNRYSYLWQNVRDAFNNGSLRFDDMKTKSVIFDILGVDMYK